MFLKILATLQFIAGVIILLYATINMADTPRLAVKLGFAALFLWAVAIFFIFFTSATNKESNIRSSNR